MARPFGNNCPDLAQQFKTRIAFERAGARRIVLERILGQEVTAHRGVIVDVTH